MTSSSKKKNLCSTEKENKSKIANNDLHYGRCQKCLDTINAGYL